MNILAMAKAGIAVAKSFAVVNAPIIFIGAAAVGVVSTAVIAWKAGKKSSLAIGQAKAKKGEPLTKTEKVKATWKLWLPVCVSIILTFGCMGASYYIHSVRLAEMTATANALLVSNKELNKELKELEDIVPDSVDDVRKKVEGENIDLKTVKNYYDNMSIYDAYLKRIIHVSPEAAIAGKQEFLDYYQENNKGNIEDLYYFMGDNLRGGAGNLGWMTTEEKADEYDWPWISIKPETIPWPDGTEKEMWTLRYTPTCITTENYTPPRIPESMREYFSSHDDLINDDELMSGINNAFA